jgi:ribose 5-phosphate isomerase A
MSDPVLDALARHALELVPDGGKIGLGAGRAATAFVACLGERVRQGLRVAAVPASQETARVARDGGIPLIGLEDGVDLDLTVDGADEVAPNLDLVKGWGGALVGERIVASASRRIVILVKEDKLVGALAERGRIPVEIIPMSRAPVMGSLRALGLRPAVRSASSDAGPFVTDNHNWIVDCAPEQPLADPRAARDLENAILEITGVVDTGLFLGIAERVLVGRADGSVETLQRARA